MTLRPLLRVALLVFAMGFGRCWAQEAPPLYVLVVDGDGVWQVEQQDRFHTPSDLSGLSTDWKELTSTRPFRRLSYNDRVALLAYPERLLSSSWAAQVFAARHVLVLHPLGGERVEGRQFDLASGREQPVVASEDSVHALAEAADQPVGSPRQEVLKQALEMVGISREPVLAHPDGLYHRVSASHLSNQVHYEPVESAQRAEAFGFVPCGICYPQASRDPLYDDFDRQLGDLVAAQIEASYPLAPEGEDTARVRRIGERILRENRFLDQGYRFEVLDTDTVNAFCAPTGPVYVTRGLLRILETDDELASVLGHELSHSERKHARRQYEQAQSTGMLGWAVTIATGIPFASLGTDLLGAMVTRGYSRGYELEADRNGMMAAYAAGYRPEDYLLVQDKLEEVQRQKGGGGISWLRTHPGGEERKEQLTEILSRTEPLRQRLDKLDSWDHGMAVYLKGNVLFLNDDTSGLSDYLGRYETFARLLDTTPKTNPPGVPDAVWQKLESAGP